MENSLATSHGKIILIGEHSVVYGKPAIAIPINSVSLDVYIEESEKNHIYCKFFEGELCESSEDLLGIRNLIEKFFEKYNIRKKIKIIIESDIPNERGMGSSAAASLAVAIALFRYFDIEHTEDDISKWANISERIIHGNPSGIDINVIKHNKSVYFIKDEKIEIFPIDLDAFLVIGDTGIKGKTKETVSNVKKLIKQDSKYMEYIENLSRLSNEARKYIEDKDLENLGKTMNKAHMNLQKLEVSCKELDEMVNIAIKNKALGAKLTGGGGGGCMIALCSTLEIAEKIKEEFENLDKEVWISNI
nr:mevalonate kinase [Helcococcus sueciensis]